MSVYALCECLVHRGQKSPGIGGLWLLGTKLGPTQKQKTLLATEPPLHPECSVLF